MSSVPGMLAGNRTNGGGWTQYGWPSSLSLQTRGGLATEEAFRDWPAGPQEGPLLPGVGGDEIFAMTEKGRSTGLPNYCGFYTTLKNWDLKLLKIMQRFLSCKTTKIT